jgi:hypothetical protein
MTGAIVLLARATLCLGAFTVSHPTTVFSMTAYRGLGSPFTESQAQTTRIPAPADTVVRNAGAPRHAGIGRLEETLSIGLAAGDPNYEFGVITDLLVAKDSSLWVLEGGLLAIGSARLRRYSQSGRFLGTVGRSGSGPGEYLAPGSLAQLPDSRVLVRENVPELSLLLYSSLGESIGEWPLGRLTGTAGNSSGELTVDVSGVVYVELLMAETGARGATPPRLRTTTLRVGSNGAPIDTVPPPLIANGEVVATVAERGRGTPAATRNVPYTPGKFWVWSPRGSLITAFANRYSFEIIRPAQAGAPGTSGARRWSPSPSILSVRRETPTVAVAAEEREFLRGRGRLQTGQVIPSEKPAFRGIEVGGDGQILVMASVTSERVMASTTNVVTGRGTNAPTEAWREPIVFDIFSAEGVYEGRIRLPNGARYMELLGDKLWCVVRDDNGVDVVKRYSIRW